MKLIDDQLFLRWGTVAIKLRLTFAAGEPATIAAEHFPDIGNSGQRLAPSAASTQARQRWKREFPRRSVPGHQPANERRWGDLQTTHRTSAGVGLHAPARPAAAGHSPKVSRSHPGTRSPADGAEAVAIVAAVVDPFDQFGARVAQDA